MYVIYSLSSRSLRKVEEATASARRRRSTGLDSASRGPEGRNCCVRCCNQSCHERSVPSSFVWLACQPGSGQSFAETSGASARDCRQSCAETSECQPEVQVTQRKEAADAVQAPAKERERPSPGTHAALLQASLLPYSQGFAETSEWHRGRQVTQGKEDAGAAQAAAKKGATRPSRSRQASLLQAELLQCSLPPHRRFHCRWQRQGQGRRRDGRRRSTADCTTQSTCDRRRAPLPREHRTLHPPSEHTRPQGKAGY